MSVTVRIGNERHVINREDVLAVAEREPPRRLNAYFVEVEGRRYPPKQLIRGATGTKLAFVTALAVRALMSLGFKVTSLDAPE
jgi:hypothetical protein